MKFLEKGIYKIFGAVILVSMIGALVAEPIAMGDIAAAATVVVNKLFNNSVSGDAQYGTIVTSTGSGAAYGFRNGIRFAIAGAEIGAAAGPEGAVAGACIGFVAGVA